MKNNYYDIGIIGGGIAALVAASSALEAGYKTILFEGNVLGGKAFNGGDLYLNQFVQATKSNIKNKIEKLHELFKQTEGMKEQYLKQLFPFLRYHENFTLINNIATIEDANTIKANGTCYNCRFIIIATGNKPNKVEIEGLSESIEKNLTLHATDFKNISKEAKKVAILGGGRIAFELAMLLVDFGVEAHILCRRDCLNHLDKEVKEVFLNTIQNDLLQIDSNISIKKIDGGTIYYNDKIETFDNIIMALGYHFDDNLVQRLGLDVDGNGIIVNNFMQTSIKNIYAIGDVNMHSKFSNVAVKEAMIAINHIRGIRSLYKNQFIYRILGKYEYAYIGFNEEELNERNIKYQKFTINEDIIIENYNQIKFIKLLISDVTREVLGLFVVGSDASTIINSVLLLLEENIDDKINARLSLFTNVYYVTRLIKRYFKEHDQKSIDKSYQPFYQVKVDKERNIIGAESLARFKQGDKYISPETFIKNFETNGLIVDLDLKAIEEGFKLINELEKKDLIDSKFKLSINISSLTIEMLEYEKILQLMKKYKIKNKKIIFEITERKTFEEEKSYVKKLSKFKSLGLSLSMDDFSVGNSSLSLYQDVNFNEVKLDMALLPKDENDNVRQVIYKELTSILRKKDNIIVSEGVENEFQFNFVKGLGIDCFQGYYFSKPLSKIDFINFINSYNNLKNN